ncbi:hypothetical protein [Methanococcoides burtonii]|uniref:Uncharacterized protein n=1 Tax=Methanococcoides burtonii (strain DSM 6242 / NBRC 107633 / OCM 468 / ACE-M) TaxID=259564 RepID=Q12XP9_METBU|nr:hypothetical protein [Methanococcoides burtonii]ABE51777.1 Hypothetical protein Mbur_0823 [Methanococcoides burtonii DSM 6242]
MEVKLSYVIDLPQIMTNMSSHSLAWKHDVVAFTENEIWFPSSSGWSMVPYRSIETVDRNISASVRNDIRADTGYIAELAIDYKKNSNFGSSYINHTMIFAGKPEDIENIRDHLLEKIGFRANTDFEGLKEEETKLLSLLAMGRKDISKHLPLISNDMEVIKRAFGTLKIRKLVDANAQLTQQGHYYLETIKEGKDGTLDDTPALPLLFSFGEISNTFTPKNNIVRFTKKFEYSSVSGTVFIEDLWYFVLSPEIRDISLSKINITDLELQLRNLSGATILIESEDNVLLLALSRILNMNENLHTRILNCLYVGIKEEKDMANLLYIDPHELEISMREMMENKDITAENTLTERGIETVKHTLKIEKISRQEQTALQ